MGMTMSNLGLLLGSSFMQILTSLAMYGDIPGGHCNTEPLQRHLSSNVMHNYSIIAIFSQRNARHSPEINTEVVMTLENGLET